MTRLAVLADVHGNLPALEAVLADLRARGVERVLVGGDLVGRGPQGSAVVRAIRERGWPCVRGNHEDYLLGFRRGEVPADWLESEEWSASRWMAAELDATAVRYIDSLPMGFVPPDVEELLLVHGSPRSHNEGLGPWTSDEELARVLAGIPQRVVVCGHTHRPMCRRTGRGLVVNVGAVGLPFNRDHRAQYALLERRDGDWHVEFRQVPYELERIHAAYESTGFLAAGGVTARLLRLELEHARPFLVPFVHWTTVERRPRDAAQLKAFLAFYDPDHSMADFLSRLSRPDPPGL